MDAPWVDQELTVARPIICMVRPSLPLIMDGWKTRNTFLLGREAYFQVPAIRFLECIQYPYRQIFPPRADRYKCSYICNPYKWPKINGFQWGYVTPK